MTPDEYRAKHRRCRTCIYAKEGAGWAECTAKNASLPSSLKYEKIAGRFCKMYKPRKFEGKE